MNEAEPDRIAQVGADIIDEHERRARVHSPAAARGGRGDAEKGLAMIEPRDVALLELLASYEQALSLALRANTITHPLATDLLDGCPPTPSALSAYARQAGASQESIERLRALVTDYRPRFAVH